MTRDAAAIRDLISRGLVCLIPASLVAYRILYASHEQLAIGLLRPVILACSVVLFFIWRRLPVTRVELHLVWVLAMMCGVLLVPSLTATEPARAFREWFKLVLMCVIAVTLCRALRDRTTARTLGAGFIIASVLLSAFIVLVYVSQVGTTPPNDVNTRALKAVIMDREGVPFNAVAFECVFAYICGICLVRRTASLMWLGGLILGICSTLTGSLAPSSVFIGSVLILAALSALHSRQGLLRLGGSVLAITLIITATLALTTASDADLSEMTDARWELWVVTLHKFSERPILGYGYGSAEDDPGFVSGGYHNEYVTALAEQGVVGFFAVMTVFGFLLRCCWKLAFRFADAWPNGKWLLFACIFLLLRATVELPGLFGTAQGPADFVAYIFLAIAVSGVSQAEYYRAIETGAIRSFSTAPHSRPSFVQSQSG
jgi:O-antigen ligase